MAMFGTEFRGHGVVHHSDTHVNLRIESFVADASIDRMGRTTYLLDSPYSGGVRVLITLRVIDNFLSCLQVVPSLDCRKTF